jgi:rod shape-determining protein MreC
MVETRSGRRFAALFFIAAFLVLLLGRWLTPVNHVALSAAAPFQAVVSAVASNVGDAVSAVVDGPRLRDQNRMLQSRYATLIRANLILQEQAHENQILRTMLRFDDRNNHMDFLTARVIDTDPNGSLEPYIIINRGTRDGLRPGMTVVDEDGYFVGSIVDLTSNAAKVLLMINPSSSVGALDLKTRASGLVEGKFDARPVLDFVPTSATIHRGDFIVTSGQDNLYPRILLLGQVVSVHHSNVSLFQTAQIQPAADFGNLEIVQVIRNFVPSVPGKLLKNP